MILSLLKRWWRGDADRSEGLIEALLDRHNAYRVAPALTLDARLAHLAQRQAAWMAKHRHLTHNQVLDGKTLDFEIRMRLDKVVCLNAGENVSAGQPGVEDVWYVWATMQGTRANIVCPYYTHIGLGTALDGRNQRYWCGVYADLVTPVPMGHGPIYRCPGLDGLDDRSAGDDHGF